MKINIRHLTGLAILGTALAVAEDERKPEPRPPARPSNSERPAPRREPLPRPSTFLGVATSQVPPALAAQLGLPEGFGLVVDEVMPDSPAGKAGVQQFDVLRLFNDQQLVDPRHLAMLVRAQGKDAEVTLTLLRKGQEQKLAVKISELPMPVRRPFPGSGDELKDQVDRLKDGAGDTMRKLREQMRDYEKRIPEFQERLRNWGGNRDQERPKPAEARPPAAPREDVAGGSATAKVRMKDETGEIEITSTNGRRHLIARNAKGDEVFNGPIDTPEQIKALPEDIRKKVERVEVRTKTETPARPGSGRGTD